MLSVTLPHPLAARSSSQPLGFGLSAGEARLAAAAHYKLPAAMIIVASPRPRASARAPPADTGRGRGPCSVAAEERGYPPRPSPGLERYPGRNRLDAAGHHEKPTTAPEASGIPRGQRQAAAPADAGAGRGRTCKIKREAPHPALMYDSQCVRAREPGVAARLDRPGRRPRLPSGGARARGRRRLEAT